MVRRVRERVTLPGAASVARAAEVAFHPGTMLAFHGADARVGGWRDDRRTVSFPMDIPGRLRFAVGGARTVTVEVDQRRETHPDRVAVTTRGRLLGRAGAAGPAGPAPSLPVDAMSPTFTVRRDERTGGVVMDGEIAVSAPAFPLPLCWIVERVAAAKAQADIRAYMHFVRDRVLGDE